MSTSIRHNANELFQNPPNHRWELVRGELRTVSPAGSKHGWIVARLTRAISAFVEDNDLGYVFGAETGFYIEKDPDTVRAPDVAFVKNERVAGELPDQFFPGAPDLAVEVLSPSDSASAVQEKSEDWLRAGSSEVWLIDPRRRSASRCRLEGNVLSTVSTSELTTAVLPGFSLQVASLFE